MCSGEDHGGGLFPYWVYPHWDGLGVGFWHQHCAGMVVMMVVVVVIEDTYVVSARDKMSADRKIQDNVEPDTFCYVEIFLLV
jgi:hypothetical protein